MSGAWAEHGRAPWKSEVSGLFTVHRCGFSAFMTSWHYDGFSWKRQSACCLWCREAAFCAFYYRFISFGCQHYETISEKQEAEEKANKTGQDAQENINTEETKKEEKKPASQNKQLQLQLQLLASETCIYYVLIANLYSTWHICDIYVCTFMCLY